MGAIPSRGKRILVQFINLNEKPMNHPQERPSTQEPYLAPEVEIVEVRSEGIICTSDPKFNGPFDPEKTW